MNDVFRKNIKWGKQHIDEILQLCSDEPFPHFFNRCLQGYYISVPFTASEYYVLYQPSNLVKEKRYLYYKITLTRSGNVKPDFDGNYENDIIDILKSLNDEDIEEIRKLVTRKEVLEIASLEPAPDNIEKAYNLVGKRSITLFPNGEVDRTIELTEKLLHTTDKKEILKEIPKKTVIIPLETDFEIVNVPVVTAFYNILYFKTASIEIYNHESMIPLLTHLYIYNKFRVSRPVRYLGN